MSLSFSLPQLYTEIGNAGWSVKKCKHDSKTDRFIAKAQNVHGEELEAWGRDERLALANLLMRIHHVHRMRTTKLSMWKTDFVDQLAAIAEAYSKAPVYEPKAAAAFMELGRDCEHRAQALQNHLQIEIVNDPEPYKSPEKMFDDIRKRRKLVVSRAGIEHPIWSEGQVIAYRIVHDVLGHAASGGGFDWPGENQAFAAHAAIVSAEAQKALFTESIGGAAYAAYYRAYGPQKVALFPAFMDRAQSKENPHKLYPGIHPSQSYPPVALPSMKPLASVGGLDPWIEPPTPQNGLGRLSEASPGQYIDPNAGWQSGVFPMTQNANIDHGDPLNAPVVKANAAKIDSEWAYLNQEDPQAVITMKAAIENAFRAVLLSPRKDLRWNTIHYQDIADIHSTDPTDYWHALENKRQEWNVARFGEKERFAHMPYASLILPLENIIYQRNPYAGVAAAKKKADQMIFRMQTRAQERVMRDDKDKPQDKQMHMYQIELKANKLLTDQLKHLIEQFQPKLDHYGGIDWDSYQVDPTPPPKRPRPNTVIPKQETLFDVSPIDPEPKKGKYGAFMGTHLQAIANISRHVDDILKAALEDVHEHDGAGHHFRAAVMQMGIQGVGPKVCSFAWLLLQPMTSQLATIDVHMMRVLGHNYDKEMSNRDYFKFERELQAGRDAAGYGPDGMNMPLGQFQWSLWDNARTGPGTHSDHSGLRVLQPLSHDSVKWDEKPPMSEQAISPDWWINTQAVRDQVAEDFDKTIAPHFKDNQIPYQNAVYTARLAATSGRTPWFTHPGSGQRIMGVPGQTLMAHLTQSMGLDPTEVWKQFEEPAVGKMDGFAQIPGSAQNPLDSFGPLA